MDSTDFAPLSSSKDNFGAICAMGVELTIVHVYEPIPLCEYASEMIYTLLEEQRDGSKQPARRTYQKIRNIGLVGESASNPEFRFNTQRA